jgi:hypothetical protein
MSDTLQLFDSKELHITAADLHQRLDAMKALAGFVPETDEHRKAAYALYKNIDRYERAVRIFQSMTADMPAEYQEYQSKKYQLAIECGGSEQPSPGGGSRVVGVQDTERFAAEVKKLNFQYKKAIAEAGQAGDHNQKLMSMRVDDVPEPHRVPYSYLPDAVTPAQRSRISFMLTEDEEE